MHEMFDLDDGAAPGSELVFVQGVSAPVDGAVKNLMLRQLNSLSDMKGCSNIRDFSHTVRPSILSSSALPICYSQKTACQVSH